MYETFGIQVFGPFLMVMEAATTFGVWRRETCAQATVKFTVQNALCVEVGGD